jgi:hypothetical protein
LNDLVLDARVVRNPVFLQEFFVRAGTLAKKPGFFSWMARVVRNPVFLQEYFVRAGTLAKKPGFEESECVQDFSSCFLLLSSCFLLPYSIRANLQINRVS